MSTKETASDIVNQEPAEQEQPTAKLTLPELKANVRRELSHFLQKPNDTRRAAFEISLTKYQQLWGAVMIADKLAED